MKLVFRQHAIERMFERSISIEDVTCALESGSIVEDYMPHPSALWLGFVGDTPLHVVVGGNPGARERCIVTAYQPDPAQWHSDWIARRKP